PVARRKARCAARDGPSVTILERCLCSIFILFLQPAGAEVWTVPRSAPLAARPRGYKYRLDKCIFFAPFPPGPARTLDGVHRLGLPVRKSCRYVESPALPVFFLAELRFSGTGLATGFGERRAAGLPAQNCTYSESMIA